jgi:hypothetical protein
MIEVGRTFGRERLPSVQGLSVARQVPHLLEADRMRADGVQHRRHDLRAVAAHGGVVGDLDQLVAAGGARLERVGEAFAGVQAETDAHLFDIDTSCGSDYD